MSKEPENPPAFPCEVSLYPVECGSNKMVYGKKPGMMLRDYFAAAALQGFLASDVCMRELDAASKEMGMTGAEEAAVQPKVIASKCYLLADAMLKARQS